MLWSSLLVLALAATSAAAAATSSPSLDQHAQQLLSDRLFQTNLRGPRWTGNDNQNTLTSLVATSMQIAGLTVQVLNTTFTRWDPRWWSLSLKLTDGTTMALPTTGYWPYSGDSGLQGITAPVHDAGTYAIFPNQTADSASLDLEGLAPGGNILFFDNPSPTRNYSEPGYGLLGCAIPQPHVGS
ncbi:hypothetical protein GGX14DRAFT_351040 [Mycena pura]|uniref:DUF1214 domain-containing protein n=1 Tax=Mycena pura TaxID=153505 RepID=A0AAD7E1R1_9AGAR|nr:hypothetical protein GGX14DRAFT_351040 [Mycena pura]